MNELSCRVIIGLVEMAGKTGITAERLLAGHRHPPEYLLNSRNFADWTTGMEVVRRMRVAAGSREAFLKIGQAYGQTPSHSYIHRFAGAVFTPEDLFGYPNKVFQKIAIGRTAEYSWRKTGPQKMELTYQLAAGHEAPQEFWEIQGIALSKLPSFLGQPDAVVELQVSEPSRAVFRVLLPPSGTLWARIGRFFRRQGPWSDPVFDLASVHHEDLLSSNQALFKTEHARAELAQELLRVADGERAKFAREIHDELAQELFAIRLFAESIASVDPRELPARARHLAELASRAEYTARSLARSYDPIAGAGGSFADAVRTLTQRHSGKVLFNLAGLRDRDFETSRASHLHRIVQEAVTNAVRHGGASVIHIALTPGEPLWELRIEDNGRGFDPAQVPEGLGLRSMAYRASQLGGTLRVQNCETGGMQVICAFLPDSGRESTTRGENGAAPLS